MDLFLCLWTANGTICSTLRVLFFESWNNPLKAGANDKVGLWMGAAVNLQSQTIVVGEETFGRGLEQHRLLQKCDHNKRSLVLCTIDLHLEWQCWTATYNKDFYRRFINKSISQDINQMEANLDSRSAQTWFCMDTVSTISITK